MAYEHRFEQYDLYMERPAPLVSRDLRLEVAERLAADGSLLLPLDEAGLQPVIETLRAEKIEALAISFLHAYINPGTRNARARSSPPRCRIWRLRSRTRCAAKSASMNGPRPRSPMLTCCR